MVSGRRSRGPTSGSIGQEELRRRASRRFPAARGPNNIAVHLFSFPSLAEYERYRTAVRDDEVAKEAWRLAEETRCILSFERSFMRPVFAAEL
jgi:hypothetical protein